MLSFFFLLSSALCLAGPADGALKGVVLTPDDAPVAGARVSVLRDAQVLQDTTADSEGRYGFPELPPGSVVLSVEADGWQPVRVSSITIQVGRSTVQRVQLTPPSGPEPLEVDARPVVDVAEERVFLSEIPEGQSYPAAATVAACGPSGSTTKTYSARQWRRQQRRAARRSSGRR